MFEVFSVSVEAVGAAGETDEFAEVKLSEDGILIDGFFADSVGLSWVELARVLQHPFAKAMLEEAEMMISSKQ